jgi:hypothetical protein
LCPQAFDVGVEAFGGLGTATNFGLHNTSHYVAPTVAWSPGHELTFRLSPNFGLTDTSARFSFVWESRTKSMASAQQLPASFAA